MTIEKPFTVVAVAFQKARTGLRSLGFLFTLAFDGVEGEHTRFQPMPMESDDPDREPLGIVIAKEIAAVMGVTPKAVLVALQKQDKRFLKKMTEALHGDGIIEITEKTDIATGGKVTEVSVGRLYWGDNAATEEDTAAVGTAIDKWL